MDRSHKRLRAILATAAELKQLADEMGTGDVRVVRQAIVRAADVLMEGYGDAALERAEFLEKQSSVPLLARQVTAEVRRRQSESTPPRSS